MARFFFYVNDVSLQPTKKWLKYKCGAITKENPGGPAPPPLLTKFFLIIDVRKYLIRQFSIPHNCMLDDVVVFYN